MFEENIVVSVIGRRIDGQQVEHGMEDVMLLKHHGELACRGILPAGDWFVVSEVI